MNTTLPTQFRPLKLEDFVGPAQAVAKKIVRSHQMCVASGGAPAAHLLVGPSGVGKTALCMFGLQVFGVAKWTLTEVFGADLTLERAQEIAAEMRLTNLFGGYRGYLFDESDRATKQARDRMLEVVGDHKQPNNTVIFATSNLSIKEFDELEKSGDAKGRFTGRFQVHEVVGPNADETAKLAMRWLPEPIATEAARIAASGTHKNGVNVRAFLKDITSIMQEVEA